MHKPTLIVLTGPTAVGKTALSIRLAQDLQTSIISGDSRQFYKDLKIGTAYPTDKELQSATHYFIGFLKLNDYYSVSKFEQDVLLLLPELFKKNSWVILTGGSGLYLDAICNGIDKIPDPDPEIRTYVTEMFHCNGIEALRTKVRQLDPVFYETTDVKNPKRLMRALEVCLQTGQPFSKLRIHHQIQRPFTIIKLALNRDREELFNRINIRVDEMISNGLETEARNVYPYRHYNALNTVGYKEMFDYFDKKLSLEQAVENIKTHTRRYAKRQLTWFKRDETYQWFHPNNYDDILNYILQFSN